MADNNITNSLMETAYPWLTYSRECVESIAQATSDSLSNFNGMSVSWLTRGYFPLLSQGRVSNEINCLKGAIDKTIEIKQNTDAHSQLVNELKNSIEESLGDIQKGSFGSIFSKDFTRSVQSFVNPDLGCALFEYGVLTQNFSEEFEGRNEGLLDKSAMRNQESQCLVDAKQKEILDVLNQWLRTQGEDVLTLEKLKENNLSKAQQNVLAIVNLAHQRTLGILNVIFANVYGRQFTVADDKNRHVDFAFMLDENGGIQLNLRAERSAFQWFMMLSYEGTDSISVEDSGHDSSRFTQSLNISFSFTKDWSIEFTINEAKHEVAYIPSGILEFDFDKESTERMAITELQENA